MKVNNTMDNQYPKRILSLGAGVQSTTLLLMMIKGEIEKADHVIFADTGWEPKNVYDHLNYLRGLIEQTDMQFHLVSQGNIRDDYLNPDVRSPSMPLHLRNADGSRGMIRRQCTSEYKLKPLMMKQRELAGLSKGQRCKEHRITTVIGISYDETQRMRDAAFSWIRNEYPLVDLKMTRQDCIDWCESNGYARPPRSACIGCPFKSNEEWRYLKNMPDEWNDAVDFDNQLRSLPHLKKALRGTPFLHQHAVPLEEADLRTDQEKGIWQLFDFECEGMCGV